MKKLPLGNDQLRWLQTSLKAPAIERIWSAMSLRRFETDEVVIREGEKSQGLYVLYEGRVVVSRVRQKTGVSMPIQSLLPGDFFGEITLLEKGSRTATVTATEPSSVFLLDAGQLRSLLDSQPDLEARLRWKAGERLSELDWLQNL
jgi:CRP/FNR family transcriptional regulator